MTTWASILTHWPLIEADLQDRGVDIDTALDTRTWRWLRTRIVGLLTSNDSRLNRALTPKR